MNVVHTDFWPFAVIIGQYAVCDLYFQFIFRRGLAKRKLRGYRERG